MSFIIPQNLTLNTLSASSGITGSFKGDGSQITNLPLQKVSASHVLYVSTDGNDANSGSINEPLKTLQAANDYAFSKYSTLSEAVEVVVLPGTYSGFNVTRRNTYFRTHHNNLRQRAVTINGPVKVQVSGTQKYNEVCGFDGFLFNTGSGANEPLLHIQGTGSSGFYVQNSQFYSNNATSNANLIRIDGQYAEEKVVIKACAFNADSASADSIKVLGGDIEIDSCTFYSSGSGGFSSISGSGNTVILADRLLIENVSSNPAIKFNNGYTFVISNSSITKGGTGRAIEANAIVGTSVLNCFFASNTDPVNNLNISGSSLYYAGLTSITPGYQVTVTGGTPFNEQHGNLYATLVSSSSGVSGSFKGDGSQITNILTSSITNFSSSVRSLLSGSGSVSYDQNTGVISSTGLASVLTTGSITGSGVLGDEIRLKDTVTIPTASVNAFSVNYIDFNTSSYPSPPPPDAQIARLFYNSGSGDLSTYLNSNGLYLNNGQQLIQRCMNKSGGPLAKGKIVHISGSITSTDTPWINIADWSNDNLSANTLGVTMESIADNANGYILTQGVITGIDLSHLTSRANGQILYLSSSGIITNIKSTAPNHTVSIGQIIAKADVGSGNNTTIYVSIQNGYELSELHDILTNSKVSGDLLSWDNSVPAWKNTKQLTGSYGLTGSLNITGGLGSVISVESNSDALKITQIGGGNAILVEDQISPDPNPFVVTSIGRVGIGTTAPSASVHIVGSFVQGQGSATGTYSHAQGLNTTASHQYSHAEGLSTIASGQYSHAEGWFTLASGMASHAEGYQTTASQLSSHAEGRETIAYGGYSHAEGRETTAFGSTSHAEGYGTIASGTYSHTEGYQTITYGESSHAEGYVTIASGDRSHAEGSVTIASGSDSHAEGVRKIAYNGGSHAEGFYTIASASYQHVQGMYNQTSSTALMIVGDGTSELTRHNILEVYSGSVVVSGSLDVSGSLSAKQQTKATSSAGFPGQICWDSNYIYVCTAPNTWKSSSLS